MKFYFAVDVETTGQFLNRNAMIAFGCTIMNAKSEEVDKFEGYMKIPENREMETRCYEEFWSKQKETFDFIKEKAKDHKEVMESFADWLDNMDLKYGSDLVLLSNNGGYDYAWMDTYISNYTKRSSIYYRLKSINKETKEKTYGFRRTWDTNSIYHGALTLKRKGEYVEWNLEKEIGCQNNKWKNDHNPLNDARNIASNYILFIENAKNN